MLNWSVCEYSLDTKFRRHEEQQDKKYDCFIVLVLYPNFYKLFYVLAGCQHYIFSFVSFALFVVKKYYSVLLLFIG